MTHVINWLHDAPIEAYGIDDYHSRRASQIEDRLASGVMPDRLVKIFGDVAALQKEFIQHTENDWTLLNGHPGHYNIVPLTGTEGQRDMERVFVMTSFDPMRGPRSSDYAFVLANPWNVKIVTKPGRMERQIAIISDISGIARDELAAATIIHSTLAQCWLGFENQPGRATMEYWDAVRESAAKLIGFNLA